MILIHVFNDHPTQRIHRQETIRIARCVLRGERRSGADINIIFIADKRMIALNSAFLDHRFTTDVLSFPLSETGDEKVEGEVYVNLDQARRQAKDYKETVRAEVARLVIHGILHLAGHDDANTSQRNRMTRMENLYLHRMNIIRQEVKKGNG